MTKRSLERKLKQVERQLALTEDLLHRRQLECRQLEAAHSSQVKLNGTMAKSLLDLRVRVRTLEVLIVNKVIECERERFEKPQPRDQERP